MDNTVVLFISGHGVHDSDNEQTYYYLSHETDRKNLKDTAVKFEVFEDILASMRARKKLFLMDTCESGEIDDESFLQKPDALKSPFVKARTARALTVRERKPGASSQSRRYLFEKDRYIFQDLARRSGAIVFSSSKGGESSYEDHETRNGFFTRAILDFFRLRVKTGTVSFSDVKAYVTRTVSEKSEKLFSEGKIDTPQHPTVDRDNILQILEFENR